MMKLANELLKIFFRLIFSLLNHNLSVVIAYIIMKMIPIKKRYII